MRVPGRWAEIGWSAAFLLIPVVYSDQIFDGAVLPRLALGQVAVLLILLPLAFRPSDSGSRFASIHLSMAVFAALAALSILVAENRTLAALYLAGSASFIWLVLWVPWTLSPDRLVGVIRLAPWGALPVALIGISQYLGWGFSRIPSNANPSATFFHRNAAAEYLICAIPLAVSAFFLADTTKRRIAASGLVALLLIFLVQTRTRGSWLGLALAGATVAFLVYRTGRTQKRRNPIPWRYAAGVLLAVVAGAALPENIQRPGAQHFDEYKSSPVGTAASILAGAGSRGRFDLWKHTLSMTADSPLMGIGPGNWEIVYPAYAGGDQVRETAAPETPHNDLLRILSESGIPAAAAWMTVIVLACCAGYRVAGARREHRIVGLGLLGVVLACAVDGAFNFPTELPASAFAFWFAVGGISALDSNRQPGRTCGGSRWVVFGGLLLTALALGVNVQRMRYDSHHLAVFVAERARDWDTVLEEGESASAVGPYRANTFVAMGRAEYHRDEFVLARDLYQKALEQHPNSVNAWNNLGITQSRLGNRSDAERALLRALELHPAFVAGWTNLGNLYRRGGRLADARDAYVKALGPLGRPDLPLVQATRLRLNLARTYIMIGSPELAREQVQEALVLSPDSKDAIGFLKALDAGAQIWAPPPPVDLRDNSHLSSDHDG